MNVPSQLILPSLLSLAIASTVHAAPETVAPPEGKLTPATAAAVTKVEFFGSSLPSSPEEKASVFSTAQVKISYADGSAKMSPLSYNLIYKTGDKTVNGEIGGGYYTAEGKPVTDEQGVQLFADAPDGQSLMDVKGSSKPEGVKGYPLYLATQFEFRSGSYGELAAGIGVSLLDQQADGALKMVSYSNVDASGVNGLWMTCAATLSPWNTHLSSEEYEPDAHSIGSKTADEEGGSFAAFSQSYFGDANKANPYHYGHTPELSLDVEGKPTLVKHYTTGRFSHELIQMMPDGKTGLMGDDAINAGFFMFIADKANDLSAGTLYAAKWVQKSAEGAGEADLKWIRLGHGKNADIQALAGQLKASDIFDVKKEDPKDASYKKVMNYYGVEWLKLKAGQEQAAAFLETRRFAAMKDATAEFTKMEGVTVDPNARTAYIAMARIERSMKENKAAPADDIRLQENRAGAVYAVDLKGGQVDMDGQAIPSEYVPVGMKGILQGEVTATDKSGNGANLDMIANPDNLKFSPALGILFIGEDSELHANNTLWAYNVSNGTLSRLATMPAGAEVTGLQFVENVNGHAYLMANVQHPGEKVSFKREGLKGVEKLIDKKWGNKTQGGVGYLGGIPGVGGPIAP
jgi:secreted PhoX family phosphatase